MMPVCLTSQLITNDWKIRDLYVSCAVNLIQLNICLEEVVVHWQVQLLQIKIGIQDHSSADCTIQNHDCLALKTLLICIVLVIPLLMASVATRIRKGPRHSLPVHSDAKGSRTKAA